MFQILSNFEIVFIQSLKSEKYKTLPSLQGRGWVLLNIQLVLSGNGLYFSGIESQVFLHIITAFCKLPSLQGRGWGWVEISLKYFISSLILQAKSQFFQRPFNSSRAKIIFIFFISLQTFIIEFF
jgi:hypothetical protein